ncbi:FKBP-type peptidyl-prolyl cis-trans isomerase [Sphingomonas sp.]|uniref:FKBP-type peptidyl-prolyl cis-trans isomerase n=1 Tax=Sphingomonas sp. TaxID=28214 RepID=UPI0031D10E1D
MTMSLHALPIRIAATLTLLAALPLADAAAQVKKPERAAPTRPVAADGGIIPLPLTPIVPATQRSCAARTPSGLGYTILRPSTEPKPAADATALVNYIGYLQATGAVFDQTMQSVMPVGEVIPGFSQGLQMVGRGGVIRLCVPAALGYGAQASGPIPANADLIFQVELMDFKTAAEIAEMRKAAAANAGTPGSPPQ